MPHELEMSGTIRFDAGENVWWADAVAETIKYLDGSSS